MAESEERQRSRSVAGWGRGAAAAACLAVLALCVGAHVGQQPRAGGALILGQTRGRSAAAVETSLHEAAGQAGAGEQQMPLPLASLTSGSNATALQQAGSAAGKEEEGLQQPLLQQQGPLPLASVASLASKVLLEQSQEAAAAGQHMILAASRAQKRVQQDAEYRTKALSMQQKMDVLSSKDAVEGDSAQDKAKQASVLKSLKIPLNSDLIYSNILYIVTSHSKMYYGADFSGFMLGLGSGAGCRGGAQHTHARGHDGRGCRPPC
jgi:hypothetical protein